MTESNANEKPAQKEQSQITVSEETVPFFPLQLAQRNEAVLVEKDEKTHESDVEMQELLRSATEESSKLSESLAIENKLLADVCKSLVQILSKLGISFNIPPEKLPLPRRARKVVLDESGFLKLSLGRRDESSAFLADYPPETVVAVFWNVMPELKGVIAARRENASKRISIFKGIRSELESLLKTIAHGESANKDEKAKPEAVSTSLPSKSA